MVNLVLQAQFTIIIPMRWTEKPTKDWMRFPAKKHAMKKGEKCEIWYDPSNAEKSSFGGKPGPDLYIYIPFIMALPCMLALYSYFAKKEKKLLY